MPRPVPSDSPLCTLWNHATGAPTYARAYAHLPQAGRIAKRHRIPSPQWHQSLRRQRRKLRGIICTGRQEAPCFSCRYSAPCQIQSACGGKGNAHIFQTSLHSVWKEVPFSVKHRFLMAGGLLTFLRHPGSVSGGSPPRPLSLFEIQDHPGRVQGWESVCLWFFGFMVLWFYSFMVF